MSKTKSFFILAIVVIAVAFLIVISYSSKGSIMGFQASSVNLEIGYKDGSDTIVTDIFFSYDNIKPEKREFKIYLEKNSNIVVSDLISDDCKLEICQSSFVLHNEIITNDTTIEVEVMESGVYDLVLTFGNGQGSGKIFIH